MKRKKETYIYTLCMGRKQTHLCLKVSVSGYVITVKRSKFLKFVLSLSLKLKVSERGIMGKAMSHIDAFYTWVADDFFIYIYNRFRSNLSACDPYKHPVDFWDKK